MAQTSPKRWLFSAPLDLAVFGGLALLAIALVAAGPSTGDGDAPEWSWLFAILLCDVAHVWSTTFIVYLDPAEWKRRPGVYVGVPIGCFLFAYVVYTFGDDTFWRVIAYLAVFHFIRQQYGWVMLYRARNGERDRMGRWLDGVPMAVVPVAQLVYVILFASYAARAIWQLVFTRTTAWGKHLVVFATAACYYNGVITHDNDYAFMVSNTFTHGVPYMVLVFFYARAASREPASANGRTARMLGGSMLRAAVVFVATLWLVAYVEEMLWNRTMVHDHEWLFGVGTDVGSVAKVLAPLLAVPQLAHYALDAFLWKRRSNPRLGRLL